MADPQSRPSRPTASDAEIEIELELDRLLNLDLQ
jgi:hypothetical protein